MRLPTFLFFLFLLTDASAQIGENATSKDNQLPIKWETLIEGKGNTKIIVFKATLGEGWHLYSQKVENEGPIPTTFTFTSKNGIELKGEMIEPDVPPVYDEVFGMEIKFFEEKAVFQQKIKVNDPNAPIEVEVYFSLCDDVKCLPPETIPFQINLNTNKISQGYTDVVISEEDQQQTQALDLNIQGWENYPMKKEKISSFWSIFLLGFVGGLIALLTPCVFPMIPLTVSFFTKQAITKEKGRFNAFLYGSFIFLIYLLLSLPFHLLDFVAPEIFNNISTNVYLNVIFFIIFTAFAFSFFGYYEFTLPGSWSRKMDKKASGIEGWIGIFFMALTLAVVSFSCTGPILGSLLGGSLTTDGGATQLSFGMAGFGLALSLPFTLFASFPNWLKSLPKSGGWLNSFKVTLGFIELALAFKFLSNADLVEHWGILKREIFIAIWILIATGLMLYLFRIIRFPHDGPRKGISKMRFLSGTLTFLFILYLLPGLTNSSFANRKLLSGFPPPLFYSIYEKETKGPLGLVAYKSLEEGLAVAKTEKKPVILDFTGYACVNCRKMEEQVWSNPQVFNVLNRNYILISLYVDDGKELPKSDQFHFIRENGAIKKIKTVGDKWATFQTINFKNNSQPYYILMDSNGQLLNQPVGFTPNEKKYLKWLKTGLTNYNNL